MDKENSLDLNQIQVMESLFLECLISNPSQLPIGPSQIAGFVEPTVRLFPMVSVKEHKVAFDIRIHVATVDADEQPLPVEGAFRIYLAFRVANLNEQLRLDERYGQQVPTTILTASLIGTAYSTARGMIMSKVADTVIAGLALPLRSVKQLMEESQPTDEEVKAIRASVLEARKKIKKRKSPQKDAD